jgi:hypothetical protein
MIVSEVRQFIRHPADIPIEITATHGRLQSCSRNLGNGGLALKVCQALEPGRIVELLIAIVRPAFKTQARVVWCRTRDAGFEVGVEFLASDALYRARMVEQVCHIESYRARIRESEGRELTADQAAIEWIAMYAGDFPEIDNNGQD